MYGHENNIIKARVCPYFYGIQTMRPFIEGDDENKKVVQYVALCLYRRKTMLGM